VTPSHHSPTNVTLDPSRRLRLLTHMRETDSLIIEDDYDSEFRYRGKPTPALKALPHSEHVIYLGSFSKFLAPGLRLGYIVAEPELIERMRTHRRYSIRHVPGHTQRAMALLIDSGQFHRTISRRRNHLRRKWETLTAALEKHLPWAVPFPAGGVSVWIEAPAGINGRVLAEDCLRRGVVIEPGDPFFLSPEDNLNYFRLGFPAIDLEDIEHGLRLLREAIEQRSRPTGTKELATDWDFIRNQITTRVMSSTPTKECRSRDASTYRPRQFEWRVRVTISDYANRAQQHLFP